MRRAACATWQGHGLFYRPLHALPGKGPRRHQQAQGFWYHWGWAPPMAVLQTTSASLNVAPTSAQAQVPSGAQLLAPLQCSRFILSETQSRIAFEQHHQGGSCLFCCPTASPPSIASPPQLPSNCPRQPMAGGFEHNNDKRQRIQIHVLTYFFPMKADRSPFSAQEVRSVALLQKVHSIVLHCFAPHRSTSLAMPCEASIATVVRPAILAS